jgi:phosphoglucosamine mutase
VIQRRYFGTDGVRGVYGRDLTEALVARLGTAFARWSGGDDVLLGRDTRASGAALELALANGLTAGGSRVRGGGILPTPAVALLAEGCGAVISASHNPPEYNGVKFFAAGGVKPSDREEQEIEALIGEEPPEAPEREQPEPERPEPERPEPERPEPERPEAERRHSERYVDVVCERFGAPLAGLRVAVDCANGAMYEVAPAALARLGARVTAVADEPDGTNINDGCGATDLSLVADTVARGEFDLGVAFDGDGDRMLAVDAAGRPVDGDQILAVLALHLGVDAVVVTAMANLGFHRLMAERGIRTITTDVGDRYVLEALRRERAVLGGEQSGHLVYLHGHTTGDGLVAAILLVRALVAESRSLDELVRVMPRFPQAKENVEVMRRELTEAIRDEVARLNAQLDGRGRVLVRASGTEPLVRVLVEAETDGEAKSLSGRVASLVRTELG